MCILNLATFEILSIFIDNQLVTHACNQDESFYDVFHKKKIERRETELAESLSFLNLGIVLINSIFATLTH
ncbi:MAG: hypothetical protein ACI837_002553 [Crocinitomicaceae bacterium]|jgi:hypothetical protein